MNRINIDLQHTLGEIDSNIFGGFIEHLGRCIYDGIYEPTSSFADEDGLRTDVLLALKRMNCPILRYPGGSFASGYRWMDGVGPKEKRTFRHDLCRNVIDSNEFGTDEFIRLCRKLNTQPYLCVNCGDGDMREAADWVEYCNGIYDTDLVKLRRGHGFEEPHKVKYWGIGNEVDGPGQIGHKTPQEYSRAVAEFGKVMKRADPEIKIIASATCTWQDFVERGKLMLEQAGDLIDYTALHWYAGNPGNSFNGYMTVSELFEERLSAYEGLIRAVRLDKGITHPIYIAVDEWNVWYRARSRPMDVAEKKILFEEHYNLEDALVVAMNLNAFIRHAYSVRMANIAQNVNVIAPILTQQDSLLLQTTFYPFELYRQTCGQQALNVYWDSETFSGTYEDRRRSYEYSAVRILDVAATLDKPRKVIVIYVVNRNKDKVIETMISLAEGQFTGDVQVHVINGADIKTENTFEKPNEVVAHKNILRASGKSLAYSFEPHSVTALVCPVN